MAYIFLDESGDLGFDFTKRGTSSVFVITFLFIDGSKRPIEKIVSRTHGELNKSVKRRIGVLHATNEKPITRRRLLKRLAEKDCAVMAICLNKKNVHAKLRNEKQALYNYVANILLDRIYTHHAVSSAAEIELVASRRETNRFLNDNFRQYLSLKVKDFHHGTMRISIKTPREEKILQAVDFVSWSIFRKYEKGDDSYYDIIKRKIVEENPLFP